jgi:DNA polymerase V
MIFLVDANNFYVSAERIFRPDLESKPVVVLSSNDGNVIARSNEAKNLKIPMGEPVFKLPELVKKHNVQLLSANFTLYGDISARLMRILNQFVEEIEIYSIDEAFLDLTTYEQVYSDLPMFAHQIKSTVNQWIGLPVSVGIAPNKTLSKVANWFAKRRPEHNGVFQLSNPDEIQNALSDFPCGEVWGIGHQYNQLLKKNGIITAYDLTQCHDVWIQKHMTIDGLRLVDELRGNPRRSIQRYPPPKKSILTSPTFGKPVDDLKTLQEALTTHVVRCAEKLRRQQSAARLLTVYLQTNPFRRQEPQYFNHQSVVLPHPSSATPELLQYAIGVLNTIYKPAYHYKRVGVMLSGFVPEDFQQSNLFTEVPDERLRVVSETIDDLNEKYGRDKIRFAAQGYSQHWKPRSKYLSRRYTTRWDEILRAK